MTTYATRRCVTCDRPTVATYHWEQMSHAERERLKDQGIVKRGTAERCRPCAVRFRQHGDADHPGPRPELRETCVTCGAWLVKRGVWASMPADERAESQADGFLPHKGLGQCTRCYARARAALGSAA